MPFTLSLQSSSSVIGSLHSAPAHPLCNRINLRLSPNSPRGFFVLDPRPGKRSFSRHRFLPPRSLSFLSRRDPLEAMAPPRKRTIAAASAEPILFSRFENAVRAVQTKWEKEWPHLLEKPNWKPVEWATDLEDNMRRVWDSQKPVAQERVCQFLETTTFETIYTSRDFVCDQSLASLQATANTSDL